MKVSYVLSSLVKSFLPCLANCRPRCLDSGYCHVRSPGKYLCFFWIQVMPKTICYFTLSAIIPIKVIMVLAMPFCAKVERIASCALIMFDVLSLWVLDLLYVFTWSFLAQVQTINDQDGKILPSMVAPFTGLEVDQKECLSQFYISLRIVNLECPKVGMPKVLVAWWGL